MNSFWRDVIPYSLGPNAEPGTTHCLFTVKISFHHYLIMNLLVFIVKKLHYVNVGHRTWNTRHHYCMPSSACLSYIQKIHQLAST